MEKNYIVYEHINKINNKKYIGITKNKPEYRWNNGKGYISNSHFYQAIQKYGWENFEHKILFTNLTKEEACFKEILLIKLYDLTDPNKGYNISTGGQTGPKDFSAMKEYQNTHKKFGEDNINSKKVKCIETNDVFGSISEACRWCGSNKVSLVCNNKREHAGRHPVTNQLLSWKYADENEKVTIVCNEPLKEKNNIKKVKCIETNKIFSNASEAGRFYDIEPCNILRVCQGKRKTAGKKHWIYIDD